MFQPEKYTRMERNVVKIFAWVLYLTVTARIFFHSKYLVLNGLPG